MSVIAAVATEDGVHLACDSATSLDEGGATVTRTDLKIATVPVGRRARAAVATAGRSALQPLARRLSAPHEPDPDDPDDLDGWAQAVAEALTADAAETKPSLLNEDGDEFDGEVLLALHGRLWLLAANLAIHTPGYLAIGSGRDVALGVLHALHTPQRWISGIPEPDLDRLRSQVVDPGRLWTAPAELELHGVDGRTAVELAVQAACDHNAWCRPPVRHLHLPRRDAA